MKTILLFLVLSAQPLVNDDILEPSVRNEVDHALSRAPTNAPPAAMLPFATNGLTRTQIAIRLVSEQKSDGRWFVGTNDVTSAAIDLLCFSADIQIINGQKFMCHDGVCELIEDDEPSAAATSATAAATKTRITQGIMSADAFIRYLENDEAPNDKLTGFTDNLWLLLLAGILGGLILNATPCVLPMIPVTLLVVGRSATRGAVYGLGLALTYGALGVASAVGGLAFGTIQSNPYFNACVAAIFIALALALLDVWFIDLSHLRPNIARVPTTNKGASTSYLMPLVMGSLSALLAGACVAPVLISTLLLTADLFTKGHTAALALPFSLGLGMALPWPFLGAGLRVLPKPGNWMKYVNRLFAALVLLFAAWHGYLSWQGFTRDTTPTPHSPGTSLNMTPATFSLDGLKRPVLVDCWATWCKNCAAMEHVLSNPKVQSALESFTVIRLQAEDMKELKRLSGFESIQGLPAFVIFE